MPNFGLSRSNAQGLWQQKLFKAERDGELYERPGWSGKRATKKLILVPASLLRPTSSHLVPTHRWCSGSRSTLTRYPCCKAHRRRYRTPR